MNKNRVVWNEGLFLRPQHLQQQERFLQHWIESRCKGIRAFNWGLTQLELDEQHLTLGKVSLNKAQGVFPDGTPFDSPGSTPFPTPLQIPNETKNEVLYLAIPLVQHNALLMSEGIEENSLARYQLNDLIVPDLHSAQIDSEADIQVGELTMRFLLESEKRDAYSVIPIARVIDVTKNGAITLDKHYIPAVMACRAAPVLSSLISEIQGKLNHRGKALAKRLTAPSTGSVSGVTDFLFLQLINRFESLARHYQANTALHPEELFRFVIALAGELATFTPDKRPVVFPDYIHHDQQQSFEPIMDIIRRTFETPDEQKTLSIPITKQPLGIWGAQINDKSLLSTAMFVLAVKADVASETIRSRLPKQITIAMTERIRELVHAQVPGIEISPLAVAPHQIPFHTGFNYFEINTHHEWWSQLEQSGGLAMHIGIKLENLEMELWAIRE
jgi:type VI secretion system protein ImpJ